MIKSALLIAVFSGCLSFSSYGQVYERIYESAPVAVQEKMNQNKMSGLNILTGIRTHHVITFSSLTAPQKTQLEGILAQEQDVLNFTVTPGANSVVIDSKALFSRERFNQLIQGLNLSVAGYTETYSLND